MDPRKFLEILVSAIKSSNDPFAQISLWLQVYLLDHKGKIGEQAHEEIVALASAMGGPAEILDCWVSLWLGSPLGSVLSARARKEILALAESDDFAVKAYCALPKDDFLKKELNTLIDNRSKTRGFSYEFLKRFYECLPVGDRMETYVLWGMSRQADKNESLTECLEVYGLIFRLTDTKLEERARKSITKLSDSIEKKIFAHAQAPLGSKLEEEMAVDIMKSLSGSEDMLKVYLLIHRGAGLKKMLRDSIEQAVSKLANIGKMYSFWILVYSKSSEGDEIKKMALEHVKTICDSVGKGAIKALQGLAVSFTGTELGDYAKQKLAELAPKKVA